MKKTIFILFVIIFAVALAGCSERISFENYTVSFDSMGGSAVPENAFSSIKTCPEPLKDGYVFEGWYEESDFSSEMVQFPYEATKNVTLYAKYIDIKTGNEEIKYALEGDVAVAVTYTGSSKNVVVPDFFEGKSVVKVASGFVKNINSISRFYFGSELKSIEEGLIVDLCSVYDNKVSLKVGGKSVALGELAVLYILGTPLVLAIENSQLHKKLFNY